MYDNFTAQNHTTYCRNKMLYLGEYKEKCDILIIKLF